MFWQMIEFTLAVTIVAMLIMVMKFIFHDKLDARWHYMIWLVLAVRMVTPIQWKWLKAPISLFDSIPLSQWIQILRYEMGKQQWELPVESIRKIYWAGAFAVGAYYLICRIILQIQIVKSRTAPQTVYEAVNGTAVKYGLKPCKSIRLNEKLGYCVSGFLSPVLLLPEHILTEENVEIREEIILHELFHMKHGDVCINYCLHILRIIFWFHPLFWFVTSMIQNDSEALCDQRVLEAGKRLWQAGETDYTEVQWQKRYGTLLLEMAELNQTYHFKIGTTDMANSKRHLKIRIRRIVDFGKVPAGIGFVALCITLILSISSIAYSDDKIPLLTAGIRNETDLNAAIRSALLYQADTPQEALTMYLNGIKEGNPIWILAVTGKEEQNMLADWIRERYAEEEFYHYQENHLLQERWVNYRDLEPNPYFTVDGERITDIQVYNLLADSEETNTVTVAIKGKDIMEGSLSEQQIHWELELFREEGWKVRKLTERYVTDAYEELPVLLKTDKQQGDWLVEAEARNESHFAVYRSQFSWNQKATNNKQNKTEKSGADLSSLLTDYKNEMYYLTYLGERDLEGTEITVMIQTNPEDYWKEEIKTADLEKEKMIEKYKENIALSGQEWNLPKSSMFSSSEGYGYCSFDGKELMNRERRLVLGGGNGYERWSREDCLTFQVWIFLDGECVEVISR